MFEKANDVCFRDKKSYDLFKDFNNIRFAYDSVLSLNYKPLMSHDKDYNLISIMNFKVHNHIQYQKYEKLVIDLVKEFINKKEKVRLMSFNSLENDDEVAERITSNFSENDKELISYYKYNGDMDEALEIVFNSKSIIATRYHSFILALLFDIPFFTIIYDQKTKIRWKILI